MKIWQYTPHVRRDKFISIRVSNVLKNRIYTWGIVILLILIEPILFHKLKENHLEDYARIREGNKTTNENKMNFLHAFPFLRQIGPY